MNGSRVTEINDLEIHVLRRMPEQISTWTRSSKQLACLRKKLQYDLNSSDEQINDVSVAKAEAPTRRFTGVLMKRANWDRPRQHRTRTERFPYLPGHNLQICKVYIHTTL